MLIQGVFLQVGNQGTVLVHGVGADIGVNLDALGIALADIPVVQGEEITAVAAPVRVEQSFAVLGHGDGTAQGVGVGGILQPVGDLKGLVLTAEAVEVQVVVLHIQGIVVLGAGAGDGGNDDDKDNDQRQGGRAQDEEFLGNLLQEALGGVTGLLGGFTGLLGGVACLLAQLGGIDERLLGRLLAGRGGHHRSGGPGLTAAGGGAAVVTESGAGLNGLAAIGADLLPRGLGNLGAAMVAELGALRDGMLTFRAIRHISLLLDHKFYALPW